VQKKREYNIKQSEQIAIELATIYQNQYNHS